MRDYALNLAQSSDFDAVIPTLMRGVKGFFRRKKLSNRLQNMCGLDSTASLTAADVSAILALPLSANIELEIERRQILAARPLR